MSKQRVEIFLARRLSSRKLGGKSVMLNVATEAVAVSVAVMIVALAVVDGFKVALVEKMTGMVSHLTVEPLASPYGRDDNPLERSADFENRVEQMPHFATMSAWVGKTGIIKSRTAMQGVLLRGEEPAYDSLFFRNVLTDGKLPRIGGDSRYKDVLLSQTMANRLEVGVGDKVEVVFTSPTAPIRRDAYKVCGIYSTGMESMELHLAITDLRNVQRLNGWSENQVSGYHISADNFDNMEVLGGEVRVEALHAGGNNLWHTADLKQSYPQIFNWLATHDINALVIVVIMVVVALLNMITALLIIIFERIGMIGTLKSLGMRNGAIQRLFLWRSLSVILRGMLWGNVIGVLLVVVQATTGIVTLNPEAYLLSAVPVEWGWGWWLGLNVGVPVVLTLLLSLPVAVVSRIKPDQTLKYQ